ncbi:hypothetical protein [Fluviicola sp.]|uniref:hypothetical protein n=1 Tax=Fluviicola sp. TaxID=1917219 RepID=UPI0031E42CC6
MIHNTLKWLSCSFILLSVLSCKKEKGALDDLNPGKFDFVYILNNSSGQDTVKGELSGPYIQAADYYFWIKQDLQIDKSLKFFRVGTYKSIINQRFLAQVNTNSTITYEDHNSDNLLIQFESGDTLSGSLTLTRKE